jgi:hypothetical protein
MPDRALLAFRDDPDSNYVAVVIERFHPTGRGVSMLRRLADVHTGKVSPLREEVLGRRRRITAPKPSSLLLQVSDADWIVTWDDRHCRVWVSSPLRHGLTLWAEAHAGERGWR